LHEFLADVEGVDEVQLCAQLEAEGVSVDEFLNRLGAVVQASQPSVAGTGARIHALVKKTKGEICEFLGKFDPTVAGSMPANALARSGKSSSTSMSKSSGSGGKRRGKNRKQSA